MKDKKKSKEHLSEVDEKICKKKYPHNLEIEQIKKKL